MCESFAAPTGKSISVSDRVVCASGQARRSGVGAYGASASNAAGIVAKISTGPGERGSALLHRHEGFRLFLSKVCCVQGFHAAGLFCLRRRKGFKGIHLRKPQTRRAQEFSRLLDSESCLCPARCNGFKALDL